jgi:hypothetical protein
LSSVHINNYGAGVAEWEVKETTWIPLSPVDVPWVSESSITGTLAADSTQLLDVTFEALPGMLEGLYTAYLQVESSDAFASPQYLTVTMRIASDFIYLPLVVKQP